MCMCCEDENFNFYFFVYFQRLQYNLELLFVRTYWKLPHGACLLSREVAIEIVRIFASSGMVDVSYSSSSSELPCNMILSQIVGNKKW